MTGKRGRKPKYLYTIVLDGINARDIYKEYKSHRKDFKYNMSKTFLPITEYSNINNVENSTTHITDLGTKIRPTQIYYDQKKDSKIITMLDYINYGCLPERTDIWCYHCSHSFNTSPIGLPIKYVNKKKDKINEKELTIETGINDYFLTYGIFCSFSCCLAFLKINRYDKLYRDSKSLLYSLYYKLYQKELNIKSAPSWECLKVFGGQLSIEDFRKSFCKSNYVITNNIKRPYMVSVGKYIEETKCGYI